MKRDFLEGLGLEAETIDKIMAANGKDIESVKAKYADYDDVKKQLETANATLEKFKDYDQTKAEVEKYKVELEKSQKDAEAKIHQMELQAKIKDFTDKKKFVNDLTRDAINSQMESALNDEANKGKSMDEILKSLTDGKAGIFEDENKPTPPVVPQMVGTGTPQPQTQAVPPAPKASWNRFKG